MLSSLSFDQNKTYTYSHNIAGDYMPPKEPNTNQS